MIRCDERFAPEFHQHARSRPEEFGNHRPLLLILLCALSFLVYASAVLIQGQYRLSIWGSDNGTQVPGAVSYAAHGSTLGTIDDQVRSTLTSNLAAGIFTAARALRSPAWPTGRRRSQKTVSVLAISSSPAFR
jgi:hypothetical protein